MGDQELLDHCSNRGIQWKFTPEHAPHFGALWEATVESFKMHLRKVVGETRLTYEEVTTILAQVEACLNSRSLTSLPDHEPSDALEVLTPIHFLIRKPLTALPDSPESDQPIALTQVLGALLKVDKSFLESVHGPTNTLHLSTFFPSGKTKQRIWK